MTYTLENLENSYLRAGEDVLFQVVDDEVVLLNLDSGEYFGLNEVGARIWVLSSKGRSLGSILKDILERYEVEAEDLIRDVMTFLHQLEEEGLVSIVQED
jgi:hypothetical protein